jgi:hypothetical protein
MKTQINIIRTAAQYAFGAALAIASYIPANAASHVKSEMANVESRLEYLDHSIEKSIKYVAPAVDAESEAAAFETSLANERLANLAAETEASVRFVAPAVDVVAEVRDAEAAAAAERLESLSQAVEKTIRFDPAEYNLSSL